MSPKILLPASLICGLIGGMIGHMLFSALPEDAEFKTVTVTDSLVIAPEADSEAGCRLSADGTVMATGGLVANQVRGNLIAGQSIVASLNATQQPLENQLILAELTASPAQGGMLIVRDLRGVKCPANGDIKEGFATFVGYDEKTGAPAMFVQDIAKGPAGRGLAVFALPKNQSGQGTQPSQPGNTMQSQPIAPATGGEAPRTAMEGNPNPPNPNR